MYSISTRLSGPFATIQLVNETELRLACVQCAAPSLSSTNMLTLLLSDANTEAQHADVALQWPTAMAAALTEGLASHSINGLQTTTLLFVALQMIENRVFICSAGDLRVHL